MDFGIARDLNSLSLTATEAINGPHSLGYAAPEQIDNLKEEIDSRADIFSLGVIVYECLTGTQPFLDGAKSVYEVMERTRTTIPMVKIEGDEQNLLLVLVQSMMARLPSKRPLDATEALNILNYVEVTISKG